MPQPIILNAICSVAIACVCSASASASSRPADTSLPPTSPAYQDLLDMRFSQPTPVPEEGIILEFEGARWTLLRGTFWLQKPIANGLHSGLAFEGEGRFEMDVPDEFELHQLRRFSRQEEMTKVESNLSQLYLRAVGPEITEPLKRLAREANLFASDPPSDTTSNSTDGSANSSLSRSSAKLQRPPLWVRDRRERWLLNDQQDTDARVIAALSTFAERYLRADQRLEKHGWTTFSYDARQREEIQLTHPTRHNQSVMKQFFSESWLKMDKLADREDSGRPGEEHGGFSSLAHLDLAIDLTKLGEAPAVGFGKSHPMKASVTGTARFQSRRDGLGALVVQLDPRATDVRAHSPTGNELVVLRYHRGQLTNILKNDWGTRHFVVLLDAPINSGESIDLDVSYELELINYAPAVSWHPSSMDFDLQPITANLEFTTRGYYDVLATGTKVAEESRGDQSWSRWEVRRPTRVLGFSFARLAHSAHFEWEGLPPLTIFGTTGGYLYAKRIESLERFFGDNLRCLVESLGPPRAEELMVTLIAASHSQSFEGFIQVTEAIAKKGAHGVAVHGTKELLAAHELAHQWWGHQVVPDSDRDVWLSESLAEYSAALCVRRTADDGERLFGDIISAFTNEIHGSIVGAFNAFARPTLAIYNNYERKRMPPISHGARGAVSNNPWGNLTTLYRKGALIIHMADELLQAGTGNRNAFDRMLADLARNPEGEKLSTAKFQSTLQQVFKDQGLSQIDWNLLFDQWVRKPEVPTWRVAIDSSQDNAPINDRNSVAIQVQQSGVPAEFISWVPVEATFSDGHSERRLIRVFGDESHTTLDYDERPTKVEFNVDQAVPARVHGRTLRRWKAL